MAPRAALLSAFLLLGCFPPGEGASPPLSKVYFPVGLAVEEQGRFLYVVNSDFDLQYNAGTVQSWDLPALRDKVPRYCESDADCDGGKVCDRFVPTDELEQNDPAHFIDNGGTPSHWCVRPGPGTTPCGLFGEQDSRERALYPGRCGPISQTVPQDGGDAILPIDSNGKVVSDRAVIIGAFATDVLRKTLKLPPGWTVEGDPDELRQRLFIPVRGDATLHWIDANEDGTLECGQHNSADGTCDGNHRAGDSPEQENTRNNTRLEPEPFGLDADETGLNILVSNQTSGAVSLFSHLRKVEQNVSTIVWGAGPKYQFREGGMPRRPIGIANLPIPLAMPTSGRERLPGFLVSFRDAPTVFMLRVYDDAAADPARPYTRRYESERIATNSSGIDSRGIGVDAFHRLAAEDDCLARHGISRDCALDPECPGVDEPDFQACLSRAAATPLEVFIANRAPSSLVLGRTEPLASDSATTDIPSFYGSLPLDLGPSRSYVGNIINLAGELERRVFVLCFDSKRIAIYDPERRRLEAEVVTGRGPHAFALDVRLDAGDGIIGNEADHAFAYVGHFLDSYVGVIDLDQRHRGHYGTIIANVGKPLPPRASK
jgi:hypothetical protein